MKIDKVKEFVEYAKSAGVAELKYESGDMKLSVKLTPDAPVYVGGVGHTAVTSQAQVTGPSSSPKGGESNQSGLLEVTSPFVGTFYRSSSPDSGPYVKPGDRISNGQALCIVEAMKIMNEIESEVSGEIVEICVENETYVEFGQVLFRVKP